MSIPRTPSKMVKVGPHWIMRIDDGEEDTTVRPTTMDPKLLAEEKELAREAFEQYERERLNPPGAEPEAPPDDSAASDRKLEP